MTCILSERHRAKCVTCPPTCLHKIALHGLNGVGGRISAANLPEGYKYLTLTNSPVRTVQGRIYTLLTDYVATFERQFDETAPQIKSLYLFSKNPGTGKTTTACALANEYLIVHYLGSLKRGRRPLHQPTYFLDVNEFQTEYNLATMTDDEAGIERIKTTISRCRAVPFLVMDDIGVRDTTEAFRAYLHAIINRRVTSGLPTVYTSNLPIEDMAKVFDARLYDRIRDMCLDLYFDGESKRGRR